MKIWFTSDQHFGHQKVIEYCQRPFASVEVMNEEIVRRFNDHVGREDVTFHIGDFSLHPRELVHLPKLNGVHHLIAGNHDRCHPIYKKQERYVREYLYAGFQTVTVNMPLVLPNGLRLRLCHLPYTGDHYGEDIRYPDFRPKDEGFWLLHGHVHNAWKVQDRMINVGVDQWNFTPVSSETITRIIDASHV